MELPLYNLIFSPRTNNQLLTSGSMSTKNTKGTHTCKNCGHQFEGKVCNQCGEKVFHEHHLSAGHFFHDVIDFFYHF